jgi:GNAT superfamily N-acetyltransferase
MNTSHSRIAVRSATPADVAVILGFIKRKAAFDGVPDWVEATEDALREALFGSHPTTHVLLGELDGRVAGFAIYFLTFSSFLARSGIWLDDLYVDEGDRGSGVGSALLTRLAAIAAERGYGRLEWVTATDNTKGLAFYRRNGAEIQEKVRLLRLGRKELSRLAREGAA